jgi:hypothetical protein
MRKGVEDSDQAGLRALYGHSWLPSFFRGRFNSWMLGRQFRVPQIFRRRAGRQPTGKTHVPPRDSFSHRP